MSRNIKDWTIKEPVKGNRYELWKLFPGSVFTISTPTGITTMMVEKQKGDTTICEYRDGSFTSLDSSILVTAAEA